MRYIIWLRQASKEHDESLHFIFNPVLLELESPLGLFVCDFFLHSACVYVWSPFGLAGALGCFVFALVLQPLWLCF